MSGISGATTAQPTISITDAEGVESDLLLIEGQSLEQYFASSSTLKAPTDGEFALMDGIPVALSETVPEGATIVVGKLPKNG